MTFTSVESGRTVAVAGTRTSPTTSGGSFDPNGARTARVRAPQFESPSRPSPPATGGCCQPVDVTASGSAGTSARKDILQRQAVERKRAVEIRQGEPPLSDDEVLRALGLTDFRRTLKSFQVRDLARLMTLDHGANFSVPGAGKTTVELALYSAERQKERVAQLLVVAPLSAFDAWMVEASSAWSPPPYCIGSMVVASRSTPRSSSSTTSGSSGAYKMIAEWVRNKPTLVVLDEAHRMKRGRDGEWGAACLDLGIPRRETGRTHRTPAPQRPQTSSRSWTSSGPDSVHVLPDRAWLPTLRRARWEKLRARSRTCLCERQSTSLNSPLRTRS